MNIHKKIPKEKKPTKPSETQNGSCRGNEDFSHIGGDAEDFIFSFSDNKKHSEK